MTPDPAAVPNGWQVVRLGDVLALEYGVSLPERDRLPGPIPVVGSAGVVGVHDRATNTGPGVIVGRKGSIGAVTWVASDFIPIDTTYYSVPVGTRADLRWIYHVLTRADLAGLNRATGVPGLSRDDVYALRRPVPPLAEQRAIAAVLDAIDEAIERTEEVIAATERLRDALLHELLTRGLPGRHSEWADVPGLGTVPACWDVVPLGEVCQRPEYGANTPAVPFDPALPRYVRITDITDDGRLRTEGARSAEPSATRGYKLDPGDLLFARSGATVGKTYLHRRQDGPCAYAGYLIRFRALPEVASPEFLERWTRSQFYGKWVASMLRAGAQPNINAAEYASLRIPFPPLEEQQSIAAVLDGVDGTIARAREERARLHSLQASAADALLTGRVRVADATGEAT